MSQTTISLQGAVHGGTLDQLNANFNELYDAITGGTDVVVATIAAAGSAQGDATAIASGMANVTGADGTKGVILPASDAGAVIEVYNSVATNGLKVYPPSSGTLNGGSANAAVTIEGQTLARFVNMDGTNWGAIFTANT